MVLRAGVEVIALALSRGIVRGMANLSIVVVGSIRMGERWGLWNDY